MRAGGARSVLRKFLPIAGLLAGVAFAIALSVVHNPAPQTVGGHDAITVPAPATPPAPPGAGPSTRRWPARLPTPRPAAGGPAPEVRAAPETLPGARAERHEGASSDLLLGAGLKLLVGALGLVGLLYVARHMVRRLPIGKFLPGRDGPIKLTARTHLGPKESLCLVEVGRTTLLVAITATAIQTLHVWPEGLSATSAASARSGQDATPVPGQLRGLAAWRGGFRG